MIDSTRNGYNLCTHFWTTNGKCVRVGCCRLPHIFLLFRLCFSCWKTQKMKVFSNQCWISYGLSLSHRRIGQCLWVIWSVTCTIKLFLTFGRPPRRELVLLRIIWSLWPRFIKFSIWELAGLLFREEFF